MEIYNKKKISTVNPFENSDNFLSVLQLHIDKILGFKVDYEAYLQKGFLEFEGVRAKCARMSEWGQPYKGTEARKNAAKALLIEQVARLILVSELIQNIIPSLEIYEDVDFKSLHSVIKDYLTNNVDYSIDPHSLVTNTLNECMSIMQQKLERRNESNMLEVIDGQISRPVTVTIQDVLNPEDSDHVDFLVNSKLFLSGEILHGTKKTVQEILESLNEEFNKMENPVFKEFLSQEICFWDNLKDKM